MTIENITDNRQVKIRFFATYAISIAIIVFLFSWFWQDADAANTNIDSSTIAASSDGDELVKADEFLHQKSDALNKLYSSGVWQGNAAPESRNAIQAAEASFSASLDSLQKRALTVTDEQQKQKWAELITSFKNNFYSRSALQASYTQLKNAPASQKGVPENNNETIQLKALLDERDRTIASLQSKINNAPVSVNTSTGDKWKQEYAQLKKSYDNLNNQIGELKNSYRTVIEDNRRLLSQIQSAKRQ